jgi:dienelactone hydrolase
MTKSFFPLCAALACAGLLVNGTAHAEIKTEAIDYQADIALEGYLAYDDAIKEKRPAILVAHTRRGLGDFIRERTRELAKLGYVAFAADFYGKGIRPAEDEPSARESAKMKSDRVLTRSRMNASYKVLLANALADANRTAVIGYCLGGLAALELARSGTPVLGTAVFHGTLTNPNPADAKNIKGHVLVMHGAEDRTAPFSEVQELIKEMRDARVNFDLELYSGTVHGFTQPHNGNDPTRRTAYNAHADKKSWAAMQAMFNDVFRK